MLQAGRIRRLRRLHSGGRTWRLGAILGVLLVCSLSGSPVGKAADGTILRTITASGYSCSVGTGIAFDGTNLLLSCDYDNVIRAVSPADGSQSATYTISGIPAIGALAWDRTRNKLWACGGFGGDDSAVYLIDLAASSATYQFSGPGCVDGLAYDGVDDTLWMSPDVSPTVYHYGTGGTPIASFPANLGQCGNSGLAIGGQYLFLSNDGCSQIYRATRSAPDAATLFGSYPARLEDMECDDITFSDQGKAAIWSKDAYDGVLNAFELNPGDCGFGGLPPTSKEITVDVLQQTVTASGADTTIGDLPFGATIDTSISSQAAGSLVFKTVLGPSDQLKQLAGGGVEIFRSPTDWGAGMAASTTDPNSTDGADAVDTSTSVDPTTDVTSQQVSDTLSAAATLEDVDPDNPPPPDGASNVDPSYDGGDSPRTGPDGMNLVDDAFVETGDEVLSVIAAPTVTDAGGNPVAATLTIAASGKTASLSVPAGTAYPIHITGAVGFNDAVAATDVSSSGAASSQLAASSCDTRGRAVIYAPFGIGTPGAPTANLANSLRRASAPCMDYYVTVSSGSSNKSKIAKYIAGRINSISNGTSVFHAAAMFEPNSKPWSIYDLPGGNQEKSSLDKVCRDAIAWRTSMDQKGVDYTANGGVWAVDEIKQAVLLDPWQRKKIQRLIYCLAYASFPPPNNKKPRVQPMRGIVFMQVRWPDGSGGTGTPPGPGSFSGPSVPNYNSTWKSFIEDAGFWNQIRPLILAWGQETYAWCPSYCTAPPRTNEPGDALRVMGAKINQYLMHPAHFSYSLYSGGDLSAQAARLTFTQKYVPVVNGAYNTPGFHTSPSNPSDLGLDPVDTMTRFIHFEIYAAKSWAQANAYPNRRIGIAWNNNAASAEQLGAAVARSIKGAYMPGGTATRACDLARGRSFDLCMAFTPFRIAPADWSIF